MNQFDNRKFVIAGVILLVALVFLIRLFYVQVLNSNYKIFAENNALQKQVVIPLRGLVYDRKGKILINNQVVYDLMVVPGQVQELDTAAFCEMLEMEPEEFRQRLQLATEYSRYKPSVFIKALSVKTYGRFQELLHELRGFFVMASTTRYYPYATASHILGYTGEVDRNKLDMSTEFYRPGDYIGMSGIEKEYEMELRGEKGLRNVLVDVFNREKGSYMDGEYDNPSIPGQALHTSLDLDLQLYGEKLMRNKMGSIVAIEPATGEILALLSSPAYDPNLLQGQERAKNYRKLQLDPATPLFNRATDAKYRPGSIFKIVQSLVALQQEVITENTGFSCNRSLVGCHNHPPATNVEKAIQYSCNPYYFMCYKRMIQQGKAKSVFKDSRIGLEIWNEHVKSFGLGKRLGTDLPNINQGFVPDVKFYDKWYGEGRWAFSTIYSNSIGEGELGVVPIQMANLAAIIANKGYYYTPHIVKGIGDEKATPEQFKVKHYTTVDSSHFDMVLEAMRRVVEEPGGTARRARVEGITICGKTGTVQNKDREDHSVFIALAPKENPKIAIAVYVEYSGFGGQWAAPIASLMIEKYLTDSISRPADEQRILDADFINTKKDTLLPLEITVSQAVPATGL
ncbi:MAG: penicillin-binding protein 2 [Bacteroidia bacterium]